MWKCNAVHRDRNQCDERGRVHSCVSTVATRNYPMWSLTWYTWTDTRDPRRLPTPVSRAGIPGDFVRRGRSYQRVRSEAPLLISKKGQEIASLAFLRPLPTRNDFIQYLS